MANPVPCLQRLTSNLARTPVRKVGGSLAQRRLLSVPRHCLGFPVEGQRLRILEAPNRYHLHQAIWRRQLQSPFSLSVRCQEQEIRKAIQGRHPHPHLLHSHSEAPLPRQFLLLQEVYSVIPLQRIRRVRRLLRSLCLGQQRTLEREEVLDLVRTRQVHLSRLDLDRSDLSRRSHSVMLQSCVCCRFRS